MPDTISTELRQRTIYHFNWNLERIEKCLAQLNDSQIWQKPNAASNSIGNQILHLCGNIGQYVLSSLNQEEDIRQRDQEFATEGGFSKAELISKLAETTQKATTIIQSVSEKELLRKRMVQGFHYSGVAIIIHATEHYSYHTGQIIFWTKLLLDRSLDLYAKFDLNQLNE